MICKNCGKEIQEGVAFCSSCGAKAEESTVANIDSSTAAAETTKKKYPTKLVIGAISAAIIIILLAIGASSGDEESGNGIDGKSDGITISEESVFKNDLGSISSISFEKLNYGGVNITGDFTASDYYSFNGYNNQSYSYEIDFKAIDSDGKILYSGGIYTPKVNSNETCSFIGNAPVMDSDEVDTILFTEIKQFN